MGKFKISYFVMAALAVIGIRAFAQDAPVPVEDFLGQILSSIKAMGGLPTLGKISAVILLLIASMKVSILNQYVWSKLGKLQIWIAPAMGLAAGVLDLAGGGQLSLAKIMAYVGAGAGAVFIHEILDLVKAIPGLGAVYVSIINIVEGLLGGGQPPAAA